MKRAALSLVVAVAAAVWAGAGEVEEMEDAEEGGASFDVEIAPFSQYIWRGIPLTDGPVLQSSYTFSGAGVGFNVWQNVDLDNANQATGEVTENDYAFSYDFEAGKAAVSLGVLYYTFNPGDPTTEIVLGATFDVPGSPSVTLYQDVDDYEGLYVAIGAGYGFPLGAGREQTLDLGVVIGFGSDKHNDYYSYADEAVPANDVPVEKAALTDILFTVSTTFELDESLSVTPSIAFASVLDSAIVDAFDAANMNASNLILGVTLAFGF